MNISNLDNPGAQFRLMNSSWVTHDSGGGKRGWKEGFLGLGTGKWGTVGEGGWYQNSFQRHVDICPY